MATVDELTAVAAAVLGKARAEALSGPLAERARQSDLVRQFRAKPTATASPADGHGPDAVGTSAAAAAPDRMAVADGWLRAWVWRAAHVADAGGRQDPRPLDGITLGIKDVIDVRGMPTRAGSALTAPTSVAQDAPVVARARAAGAAIVGKTACTEWALNDPAPTRNPWAADRTPGGSSAGSAVAVAADLCTATIDTQTAGDVLRPAAYCGVVGFKPTHGWVTTEGTCEVAATIDTIGVMARAVDEAAVVARAVADDAAAFETRGDVRAPRIGVLVDPFFTAEREVDAVFEQALTAWRQAGAETERCRTGVDLDAVHAAHRLMTFAECYASHEERLRGAGGHRYGPRARELLDLGAATPAHLYVRAQQLRAAATQRLAGLFDGDLDAFATPVTGAPAPPRRSTGDSRFQIPWTLCGFPALTLPAGTVDGLPVGIQLVSGRSREGQLLATARWCERVLGRGPRPPVRE
jgi:Asp-tRNA(Asn)/Glu-tRNA(Gln) amidotransferase A subunit family amidase